MKKIKPLLDKARARADLEDYITDMRKKINEEDGVGELLSDKEKRIIDEETEKLMDWLRENPNATEEEIEQKKKKNFKKKN